MATAGLPLVHIPLLALLVLNCRVEPAHTDVEGPLIVPAFGCGLTVTVKVQVLVLPFASVAVYTTVDVPTGNVEPLLKPEVCTIEAPGQLSVTPGAVHETTGLQVVILPGQPVIVGGVLSTTVTTKLQLTLLPWVSVNV